MEIAASKVAIAPRCPSVFFIALCCILTACAVVIPDEQAEREKSRRVSGTFAERHETRTLPDLPTKATLEDVLYYAFHANAQIEQAYFEWNMALERIPQFVALDDPTLSFEYLFSREQMQRWDRTTLGVAQMLPAPGKRTLAGEIALQDAIAARYRFEDAKYSLQARVAGTWHQLLLLDRSIAIDEENLTLLLDIREFILQGIMVGREAQVTATRIELEIESARNELESRRAARFSTLADLNALLSLSHDHAIVPMPGDMPELAISDAQVFALVAERNPELQALAAEVRGREDALALAQKAYFPDLELGLSVRGSLERMFMGMLNLPLQFARIEAAIRETQAGIRAATAAFRAHRDDLRARTALHLSIARDATRQVAFFREVLMPRAFDIVDGTQAGYMTGGVSFLDLLDSQRSLLAIELAMAEAEAMRGTAIAELEAVAGLDFGALSNSDQEL